MPHLFDQFIQYPPTSLWRFFIDWNRQEDEGPMGFEEGEPGYLKSLFTGLNFLLMTMNEAVDLAYLVKLHDHSVSYVVDNYNTSFEKGFRDERTDFQLTAKSEIHRNVTLEGFKELCEKLKAGDRYFQIYNSGALYNIRKPYVTSEGEFYRVDSTNIGKVDIEKLYDIIKEGGWSVELTGKKGEIPNRLEEILHNYYSSIKSATSDDEKIKAIVICIHELELAHPFLDGNCRTFNLLLIKLLVQNGLKPSLITNPNRWDAYSIDQLCNEVKLGMKNFADLMKRNDKPADSFMDQPVIYLKDNSQVAHLVAQFAAKDIPYFDKLNVHEKDKAFDQIKKVLCRLEQDPLTYTQLESVIKVIADSIKDTMYKKSFYQFSIMSPVNEYGMHFDGRINRTFGSKMLFGEDFLHQRINQALPTTLTLKVVAKM